MRVRSAKPFRLLALAVAAATLFAACGDGRDDDDSSSDTTAASGTPTSAGEGGGGAATFDIDTADCETDPASVTIEGDTIKLGTSLPQSGIYAAFAEILRGEQAYIQYLNDDLGGVEVAGKTYKVELVAKDDGYNSDQTVANVDSLIADDDVFALFNVVGTKNNLAIRDSVQTNCIPNLFAATGSPAWGNPEYPWMLGTYLVPYPLEAQALVNYLEDNNPTASLAILRADDDFGRAYADTLKALIEGTDITIKQEETYDPEGAEVAAQVTSLAASGADVFVLGATLLACPSALNEMGKAGWKPSVVYMSGTCTSKTLMAAAGDNGAGVLSVSPLMDPNDPQFASDEAMTLYKEKIAQYGNGADATNGIVAYGWSAGAALQKSLEAASAPNRLAVMQAARTLDLSDVGLQLPGSEWVVGQDDWFLGEDFNLVQYDLAGKYFKPVGDLIKENGETEKITPENLING
ncbi:MAG TPA: ABC transporter substrate-binding protein [Acidimicrobiia bacterium]|nr:ABC transporter substrate-binding protein [Acidimicrobiia bacterium]